MSGQILTEEELNAVGIMVGGLLNEGNINLGQSSMIESVFLSHDAQTEYIEAQDKAAQVWMKENAQLKQILSDLDLHFDFSEKLESCNCFKDPSGINQVFKYAYRFIDPEQAAINEAREVPS